MPSIRRVGASSIGWRRCKAELGAVWEARVYKPWQSHSSLGSCVLLAERLVPGEIMLAARRLILDDTGKPRLPLDRDEDSVDGSPSYELRWVAEGRYTHPGLAAVFRETVDTRLLPLLRRSSLCRGSPLVLCEALLRYYDEDSRCVHPAHFDADALVTAVLELDTSSVCAAPNTSSTKGFAGGFYVQPGAHVSSRIPISLAAGDVVAHSFDLQHGVHVTAGRRGIPYNTFDAS